MPNVFCKSTHPGKKKVCILSARQVFINFKHFCSSMNSKRLITGLIFLFASFNAFILKQIMKRTKCTSTQIIIMCFYIFSEKISTLAYLCIYQDVTVCRLFLCAKINPESHSLINKAVKKEKKKNFHVLSL